MKTGGGFVLVYPNPYIIHKKFANLKIKYYICKMKTIYTPFLPQTSQETDVLQSSYQLGSWIDPIITPTTYEITTWWDNTNEDIRLEDIVWPTNRPTGTQGRFNNREEFTTALYNTYNYLLQTKGINPEFAKCLVAQDALESGWGQHVSGDFNYGGIKVPTNQQGQGLGRSLSTREVINGQDITITDEFRNFSSITDYCNYKINLLNNNRYQAFSGSVSEFAARVARGGYATDPNYANALNNMINSLKSGGTIPLQWHTKSDSWNMSQKFQLGGIVKRDEPENITNARQWVENWIDRRRDVYNRNWDQVHLIPSIGVLPSNLAYYNMWLTSAEINPEILNRRAGGADGAYDSSNRSIYLASDDPITAVHEFAHSTMPDEQAAVIDNIKDMNEDHMYLYDDTEPDEYLDNSEEMYARFMGLRYWLEQQGENMDRRFTPGDIRDLLKKYSTYIIQISPDGSRSIFDNQNNLIETNVTNPDPFNATLKYDVNSNLIDTLGRYSPTVSAFILTEVASNNKTLPQSARRGAKIRKAQYGMMFDGFKNPENGWYMTPIKTPLRPQYFNPSTNTGPVAGFNNAREVYDYILSLPGSNPAIAAGWTGVFMQESSLNHSAVSNAGATGIAQLLGARKDEYENWLQGRPNTWQNQVSWVWEKVNSGKDDWQDYYNRLQDKAERGARMTEKEANDWRLMEHSKYVNYSFDNYRDRIRTLTNPGDIAELMTWTFERPSSSEAHIDNRRRYAQEVYDAYVNTIR